MRATNLRGLRVQDDVLRVNRLSLDGQIKGGLELDDPVEIEFPNQAGQTFKVPHRRRYIPTKYLVLNQTKAGAIRPNREFDQTFAYFDFDASLVRAKLKIAFGR